jgi:hypothetical protein
MGGNEMRNLILIFIFILLMPGSFVLPQDNHVCVSASVGSALSASADYSYIFSNLFFVQPCVNVSITKDNKELFSFVTYEIDAGYYFSHMTRTNFYLSAGVSYNSFLSQEREGNMTFISDTKPPYYFSGRSREDCWGVNLKIGVTSNIRDWFVLGLEVKYSALYPKVKYNYSPLEYSVEKGIEPINMFLVGVKLGFSF